MRDVAAVFIRSDWSTGIIISVRRWEKTCLNAFANDGSYCKEYMQNVLSNKVYTSHKLTKYSYLTGG